MPKMFRLVKPAKMKTVRLTKKVRVLHVETPLGIINIWNGLTDRHGRQVNTVEMLPNNFAGEPKVVVRGLRLVQLKTRKGGQ